MYVSSATRPIGSDELAELLAVSRSRNGESGITGALLFHDGNFFQVVECPADGVQALEERLARDPRHRGIITMHRERHEARRFPGWEMALLRPGALEGEGMRAIDDLLRAGTGPGRPDVVEILLRSFRSALR